MPIARIGLDRIVNSTAFPFDQSNPALAVLADGRIVIAYQSASGDGAGTCIRARLWNAEGGGADADFLVNTTSTVDQVQSAVTVLSNGRFVVTWQSNDGGDGSGSCIRARMFDAGGTAIGNDFVVDSSAAGSQHEPSITALTDGRFIVTWDSEDTGDGSGGCLRGRLYDGSGNAVGNDFIVNSTATGSQEDASVTALSGGRFVVTWYSQDSSDAAPNSIRGRIFDSAGTASGNDFVVSSSAAGGQGTPSVTALADGRFVVSWQSADRGDGSGSCIRARFYGADGNALGDDFVVNTTTQNSQHTPSATALADGRFVVTWMSDDPVDGSGSCIRGRLYNVDGSPAGGDFIVNTTGTGSQSSPAVTALEDGRFVVTWRSDDTGDGSGSCIRSATFDPKVFTGTLVADTWVGGNLADSIYGGADADILSGLAGNDTINGDSGDDLLSGGAGQDKLFGGSGIDTASYATSSAGVTVNLVTGAAAGGEAEGDHLALIENVVGSAFDDILIGNASRNQLDAGAGDDTAVFAYNAAEYSLARLHFSIEVTGPDGHDSLISIEHLQFADHTFHLNGGNPLVDTMFYLLRNEDVFHAGIDPDVHYNTSGWREGRDPNGFFDTTFYLTVNRDVAAAGINPLDQYHQSGWREGRDPSARFDTTLYLINNPDVAAADIDPLYHYLAFGQYEHREIYAAVGQTVNGFDAQYYLSQNPDVAAAGIDPLLHFNAIGWREGRDPNRWFDTDGYLAEYADVAAANINPFSHYMTVGWTEGRDASVIFDTLGYLEENPDVAAAGMNPLDHFLQLGIYEGRQPVSDGIWGQTVP
jgi:Ca2+-binding RTX toxin-like protein